MDETTLALFWDAFDEEWPQLMNIKPHGRAPKFGPIGAFNPDGRWSFVPRPLPRALTQRDWNRFKCRVYTCRIISWEWTPGGIRQPGLSEKELRSEYMRSEFSHDNSLEKRFGSCLCCWKTGLRKFDDAEVTPYPTLCTLDDPRPPRLGRCGCTVCNGCVLAMERQLGDREEYPCPNCGNFACFMKEVKTWPISHEVFMKYATFMREAEEMEERNAADPE
jgi:hypothetical protein